MRVTTANGCALGQHPGLHVESKDLLVVRREHLMRKTAWCVKCLSQAHTIAIHAAAVRAGGRAPRWSVTRLESDFPGVGRMLIRPNINRPKKR